MDRYMKEIDYDNFGEYDSVHGTDHYIMTWDRLFTDPSDVYVGRNDEWQQWEYVASDDLGEDYPRGV